MNIMTKLMKGIPFAGREGDRYNGGRRIINRGNNK
jgi:hypothetical protein